MGKAAEWVRMMQSAESELSHARNQRPQGLRFEGGSGVAAEMDDRGRCVFKDVVISKPLGPGEVKKLVEWLTVTFL